MKKYILITLTVFCINIAFAKKVKFAVDMTGQVLSPNGIHVFGDFQDEAGFPLGDWQSNTTTLTQEGATNIYSIVVDIPAFRMYEYKFLNGDQSYEVEFVPVESRVGYNFDDNRWLYIDSLADDTTFAGNILFGGNAPAGLTLVRFLVNMQNEIVSANGVHVAGNFQGWNPATIRLYSFGANVYEIIAYVTAGTYEFKFYNGNTIGTEEIIPGPCSVNSNREVQVTTDIVLSSVCFGECNACAVGIEETQLQKAIKLAPNPAVDFSMLYINDNELTHDISITDIAGRLVGLYNNYTLNTLRIEKGSLENGIYFVTVYNSSNLQASLKLVID